MHPHTPTHSPFHRRIRIFEVVFLVILGSLAVASLAFGTELRWQQRDGEAPVKAWRVKRLMTPGVVATIERTKAVEETVTPPVTPWFPTVGPGTPTPVVRQYSADLPAVQAGWSITMSTEDDRGLLSTESNLKVLPSNTPAPVATSTPTRKPPEPPHVH